MSFDRIKPDRAQLSHHPERVFAAFADPTQKRRWFAEVEGQAEWYRPKRSGGYALAASNPQGFRWRSNGSAIAARSGEGGSMGWAICSLSPMKLNRRYLDATPGSNHGRRETLRRITELPNVNRVALGTQIPWRDAGRFGPGFEFSARTDFPISSFGC